ncbi:MAG: sugar transferase [Planctomycetota bacterium]
MLQTAVAEPTQPPVTMPTLWGLTPVELHDHFWLAKGIQIVRQGDEAGIEGTHRLYVLLERGILALFDARRLYRQIRRSEGDVLFLRLRDTSDVGYREQVVSDDNDSFVAYQRIYRDARTRFSRVILTRDVELARAWQQKGERRDAWALARRFCEKDRRQALVVDAHLYDCTSHENVMQFLRDLIRSWDHPDRWFRGVRQLADRVWGDESVTIHASTVFFGPIWIGAGRACEPESTVIGPAVLWDNPELIEGVERFRQRRAFLQNPKDRRGTASDTMTVKIPADLSVDPHWHSLGERSLLSWGIKRLFDICFSAAALAFTLPFYPFVMLAIYLEDGRPFFFSHRREGLGGRQFGCLKFRSMRRDAEQIKHRLAAQNRADGPQFFMDDDPRLTRIGKLLRDVQVDEWPQFWNVFKGEMSVVGPRPSPNNENQFCPAWREARLSVRPGITGLWQVMRSRTEGLDFQEWIRYDIEYVEKRSFWYDLWILWASFALVFRSVLDRFKKKSPG